MTEPGAVRLSRDLGYSPELVWEALTTPAVVATWWTEGYVKAEVGHEFALDMGPFGVQRCVVTAVEAWRLFAYTFGVGMLDTTITWELEPMADGGTRLSFEHAGFDLDSELGRQAYQGMAAGWPDVLDRLDAALADLES